MKSLLTVFVLVFFTTLCFSQDVKYGVRGGYTISNLDYKDAPINSNPHRNGFLFGVYIDYGITDSFSIVPELQFSPEGSDIEEFRNDYLNLPVLMKYKLFDRISIGVGPQVGLKVNKKNDGFKNFVFSAVGIFEIHINDEWSLDTRYHYGISNVYDNSLAPKAKNGVIQLGLNYKI